jgi:membrane-associated phospholipid phosphatase
LAGRVVVVGLAALVPVLAWARVRSGAHTLGQVVGGSLFGLVLPYAELHLLSKLALF